MSSRKVTYCFSIIILLTTLIWADLPDGFVYVKDSIPEVIIDMLYCTNDNFLGTNVDGYNEAKPILTEEAAAALKKVENELSAYGFGIKIFDAYRPQRAVNHFVKWAKDLDDTTMKYKYYPDVDKKDLFKEGYIADRSSHSRGSTVDLTIMCFEEDTTYELDMGSGFDYFGPKSWTKSRAVSSQQRANRLLLKEIMIKYGFRPYSREWWHFTFDNEPYPETYFNFPVE